MKVKIQFESRLHYIDIIAYHCMQSDKGFKGSIVNLAYPYLNRRTLEITKKIPCYKYKIIFIRKMEPGDEFPGLLFELLSPSKYFTVDFTLHFYNNTGVYIFFKNKPSPLPNALENKFCLFARS